jgi:hypothetical protein
MHARTLTVILFVAAAALMLAVAPSQAQAPPTTPTAPPAPAVKKQPPAKVTVRRRSFLDPGTETKTHQEHDRDYAFPPGDPTGAGRSTIFMQNYNVNYQIRNPFPNCFDVPGFCR